MRFTQESPCSECPFRTTSIRGWLGGEDSYNPQNVLHAVHREERYLCHMDVTRAVKDGESTDEHIEHCVGALMHANKSCKRFTLPEAVKAQKRLENHPVAVLGYMEFLEHHTPFKQEQTDGKPTKKTAKTRSRRYSSVLSRNNKVGKKIKTTKT